MSYRNTIESWAAADDTPPLPERTSHDDDVCISQRIRRACPELTADACETLGRVADVDKLGRILIHVPNAGTHRVTASWARERVLDAQRDRDRHRGNIRVADDHEISAALNTPRRGT